MAEIVLLHYTAPPVVGGVESVVGTHARLLRSAGYDVRIVAGRGGGRRLPAAILPLIYSGHAEIQRAHTSLHQGDPSLFERLRDRLADLLTPHLENRICLAHNVFTLAKNLPLTAALHELLSGGLRVRMVAWTHDLAWANPQDAGRMRDAYPWNLLKTARADVTYVAITEAVRDLLVRHLGIPAQGVAVVYTGTSVETLHGLQPQTLRILEMLPLRERFPVLLMPIRITRRKNLEMAIHIAVALRARGADPLIVVTGPLGVHNPTNRKYLADLQALRRGLGADDDVCFLAEHGIRCGPRVIGDLYLLCDAVLITSTLEGFGMPVAEAGMLRTPVFCTRIPAAVEVGGEFLTYFDPGDEPRTVAGKILTCLLGSDASRLRRRVAERFTWDAILNRQLLPLLERLARAPVRG
ncbi:MAG: glycosyltransferase [Armatimonadota bacterium]|nr:glycosyltransferase [Armatimonadota bacterium]